MAIGPRKARDQTGLSPDFLDRISQLRSAMAGPLVGTGPNFETNRPPGEVTEAGMFCGKDMWSMSKYAVRPCDQPMINKSTGASIILGKDNMGPQHTGYGGIGETKCGAIDIVVGRNSAKGIDGQEVNPLPFRDAARVYISQKTSVDGDFGLAEGYTRHYEGNSAIVAKADSLRIVGKRSVKIVTGYANEEDAFDALGDPIVPKGIDLIAWNKSDGAFQLQPLVKGENMISYIKNLHKEIGGVMSVVMRFIANQITTNSLMATHFHQSPYFMGPTTPSTVIKGAVPAFNSELAGMAKDLGSITANLKLQLEQPYCTEHGAKYICSKYNRSN